MDLAVILVTWNVRALVLNALDTLFRDLDAGGLTAGVYLVDCASSDGTVQAVREAFPQVRLTASPENLGFGRGNNVAIRQALDDGAPVLYLLNPDTLTIPGATRTLLEALHSLPRAGLVGARLSYEDGSFQHGAFHFPGLRQIWVEFFPTPGRLVESPFNGRYPRALYDTGQPFEVDFTLGATMMLPRQVVEQTQGFDPAFFMYCEEIDWAWRICKAGWSAYCVPAASIVHLSGKSTSQVRPQSVINLWTSRLLLYRKHYPMWKSWIARLLIVLGMTLRLRRESDPQVREAYRYVRRLAWKG